MAEASIAALRQALRAAAPESIPPLVKDVSVLVKLLRNPAEQPAETKFRVIKLSNATIARVLGTPGVRDVLQACGFVGDASSETLELREPLDSVTLLAAAEAVQAVQHMLQELYWLHVTRAAVPSLAAQPWSADGAAEAVVHACLGALHAPGPAPAKAEWVERLGHVLLAPEMVTCRAAVAGRLSVALAAVRSVAGWAAPEVLAIAVAVVCVAMPEVSATVTAPLCSSANFAMGTDYNDFSSGQSCYGLNPATGAGLWVYFVGAVLALASVPMLLRN